MPNSSWKQSYMTCFLQKVLLVCPHGYSSSICLCSAGWKEKRASLKELNKNMKSCRFRIIEKEGGSQQNSNGNGSPSLLLASEKSPSFFEGDQISCLQTLWHFLPQNLWNTQLIARLWLAILPLPTHWKLLWEFMLVPNENPISPWRFADHLQSEEIF